MGTLITIVAIIIAFICGVLWTKLRYKKFVEKNGCPFKHACLTYDTLETKQAVRRVLTLLIENDVPTKEIKAIIKESL